MPPRSHSRVTFEPSTIDDPGAEDHPEDYRVFFDGQAVGFIRKDPGGGGWAAIVPGHRGPYGSLSAARYEAIGVLGGWDP
jgi:hypothetical protein